MAFFVVILDSKICEAEVTLIPLINKICKPCICYSYRILSTDVNWWRHFMGWFGSVFSSKVFYLLKSLLKFLVNKKMVMKV